MLTIFQLRIFYYPLSYLKYLKIKIRKSTISLLLCGRQSLFLTLREEKILGMC
jgi:hypothetical protein